MVFLLSFFNGFVRPDPNPKHTKKYVWRKKCHSRTFFFQYFLFYLISVTNLFSRFLFFFGGFHYMDTRKKARKKGGFPLFPIEMLSCCMCVEGFTLFSSSGDGSLAARKKKEKDLCCLVNTFIWSCFHIFLFTLFFKELVSTFFFNVRFCCVRMFVR